MGEVKQALESVLAASAANPASGNDLVLLAAAYYENGDYAPRRCSNSTTPTGSTPSTRPRRCCARSSRSITTRPTRRSSRRARAARRYRTRADYFSPIATTREGGAPRLLRLPLPQPQFVGRFYSDEAFDPFVAAGYFDEAIIGQPRALQLQNPLRRPGHRRARRPDLVFLAGAGSDDRPTRGGRLATNRWTDPIRRPFFDTTISAGTVWRDDAFGPTADIEVSAFSNAGIPTSVFASTCRASPRRATAPAIASTRRAPRCSSAPTRRPTTASSPSRLYAHDEPALPPDGELHHPERPAPDDLGGGRRGVAATRSATGTRCRDGGLGRPCRRQGRHPAAASSSAACCRGCSTSTTRRTPPRSTARSPTRSASAR